MEVGEESWAGLKLEFDPRGQLRGLALVGKVMDGKERSGGLNRLFIFVVILTLS
jgi:hypothetical protein